MMKEALLTGATFALILISTQASNAATPENWTKIEIPVQALLASSNTFDENTDIQLVLYGLLQNTCYTIGESVAEKQGDGHTIVIRQYALYNSTEVCADQNSAPNQNMLVPFTTVVSVGHLKSGNYTFIYNKAGEGEQTREIEVKESISPIQDTIPYAAVTTVRSPEQISENEPIKVTLNGYLNSACTVLDDDVQVVHDEEVIQVMPTVQTKEGVVCSQMLVPFEKEVDLGTAKPGFHLIQTRTLQGKFINKVIEVAKTR